MNIDKSGWKLTKLGDLATDINKRVENPSESVHERFVGLEHFVSGDLKIKSWNSTEGLVSATKEFEAGDILFARRNAYLKRASMVDFSGVCSGDAFVLRENNQKVVSGFISFVVNSELLWTYANSNAAGTMSKRVKWRDLANYEFLLPPKDQQAKIAELLWAADAVLENGKKLEQKLNDSIQQIFYNALFLESESLDPHFGRLKSKHDVVKIGDHVQQLQYGISVSLNESGGIPVLRMNNLQGGQLDLADLKYLDVSEAELDGFILHKGDILFNRTNSYELVGKVSLFDSDMLCSFASYLIRIKTTPETLDSRYLNFFLNTALGKAKVRKYRTPGVSQSNINAQNLKVIRIPLPHIDVQRELMDRLTRLDRDQVAGQIEGSSKLLKSLINEIFSKPA